MSEETVKLIIKKVESSKYTCSLENCNYADEVKNCEDEEASEILNGRKPTSIKNAIYKAASSWVKYHVDKGETVPDILVSFDY